MRLLVTGGCGFAGSAFLRRTLAGSGSVTAVLNVDLLTYAANPAAVAAIADDPRYRFLRADIADATAMAEAIADFRPDAVVNFAAETHVDRSIDAAAPFLHSNVLGTHVLLEASTRYWRALPATARAGFRYLQVSTDEVYGDRDGIGPATVESAWRPSSPYAAAKAAGDHLVLAWARTHGLPVLITHCSNNYGPWQFPEKLLPLTISRALAGQPLPVYGDGRQQRDWIHVEDHAAGVAAVLARGEPGREYLLAGTAHLDNLGFVQRVCALLDERRDPPAGRRQHADLVRHVADRPGHDRCYALDDRASRTALDWQPAVDFDQGLAATVDWYLADPRWRTASAGQYGGQRLGVAA